jgi:hypothetical protein
MAIIIKLVKEVKVHLIKILFFCLCFQFSSNLIGQAGIHLTVVDSSNNDPVPFAGVVNDLNRMLGTTDLDGKAILNIELGGFITIKSTGYKSTRVYVSGTSLIVKLPPAVFLLQDVVILPGENRAHRLIWQAVKKRDDNNPQKRCTHCYNSYNKLVFTTDEDSLQKKVNKPAEKDTSTKEMYNFFSQQHLFITESLTEKYFDPPAKSNEKIIANRVSGFQNPVFSILATELQSFGYYYDEIKLLGVKYLNPISAGSTEKYLFLMKDTSYEDSDTLYTITFEPRKGKSFKGLKGNIVLHTKNYALKSIKAEPVKDDGGLSISINQLYEFVENKYWFPVQLNAKMFLPKNISINGIELYGDNRGYITNIKFGDACRKVKTDEIELEIKSTQKDTSIARLEKMSPVALTQKDKNTYGKIDSLGKANNFDAKLNRWGQLVTGSIPIGFINLDLNRLYTYNHHEGHRLGFGLSTNYKVSKRHSISGYGGYGFKDKVFKYGGDLKFLFYPRKETMLKIGYRNDIIEAAAPPDFFVNAGFLSPANARQLYLRKFDFHEQWQAIFSTRLLRHFHVKTFLNYQYRKPLYDYTFDVDLGQGINFQPTSYYVTETGAVLRFAFREKFVLAENKLLSQGTKFPIVTAKYTQSVNGLFVNDFDYSRIDLMVEKNFKVRNFGKLSVVAQAGKINGYVPYTFLSSFTGSYERFALSVPNSFEAVRMNEFVADKYAMLFLSHNFLSNLFYNTKSQPQLELFTNIGWGTLNSTNALGHSLISLQTMEKGYYESGVRIHSLIRTKFSRLGICLGYRYGPYSLDKFTQNVVIKITSGLIID